MKIKDVLECFEPHKIKWCCKDLDSIALIENNAGGFYPTSTDPIIDVCLKTIDGKVAAIANHRNDTKQIVSLITATSEIEAQKYMTVRQVLSKLKSYDENLEVCTTASNWNEKGWICKVIDIIDGTPDPESERRNMPKDYKGYITYFVT